MGRITVFSLDDCPHCKRVKGAFQAQGFSYVEVSLSSYPGKRGDMIALSDRLSVPQVFFNDKHIGGADETIALLEEWGTDKYEKEIVSQPDPSDPRLQIPAEPPAVPRKAPLRDASDQIHLPGTPPGTAGISILELVEKRLKPILQGERKKTFFKVHWHSFTGAEGVAALSAAFPSDNEEDVVSLGKLLMKRKIIVSATGSSRTCEFNRSSKDLFRLQCYNTPYILNSYRIWDTQADNADPMGVLNRLRKWLGKIESFVTNEKEGLVNYKQAIVHEQFPEFEEAVCELQGIDMGQLDDKTLLAFGINLYNLMIKYSFMKVGIYNDTLGLLSYFTAIKFNVGGHLFSFHDLESGILRGNRKAPYSPFAQIGNDDARQSLVAWPMVDCRIHFGLNCGAKSCPPVKSFTPEGIEEELRIVAMAFCEDHNNVNVDRKNRTLTLSQIFNWYRMDFASSTQGLPHAIVKFLRGAKKIELEEMIADGKNIKIKFSSYDWTTNASEFTAFRNSNLQVDRSSVLGFC